MLSPISNARTLSALHALSANQLELATVLRRLSSGRRINTGKDDPAGLIASERLAAEMRSREAESRAIARADANAAVAEGHMAQLGGLYGELNALVVAGANDAALSDSERAAYQTQIDSTVASINRISGEARDWLGAVDLPHSGAADTVTLLQEAQSAAASVATGGPADLNSGDYATAQTSVSTAILNIATIRGTIGAYQKDDLMPRLRSNEIALERLTDSHSRVADADYAVETSLLTQSGVRQQAIFKSLMIINRSAGAVLDLLS